MSIEWVMPSNHLTLCPPLLLLPSIFPGIRVFSNESVLRIRWPKYWSFSFSISPSKEYLGLISFRMGWLDLLAVQGTLKSLLQILREQLKNTFSFYYLYQNIYKKLNRTQKQLFKLKNNNHLNRLTDLCKSVFQVHLNVQWCPGQCSQARLESFIHFRQMRDHQLLYDGRHFWLHPLIFSQHHLQWNRGEIIK